MRAVQTTESIQGTALASFLGADGLSRPVYEDQLRASEPGCANATRPGSPRSLRW